MISLMLALQAAVQPVSTAAVTPSAACRVIDLAEQKSPANLYALCGKVAVWLGYADTYQSSYNEKMRSLLVVSARAGGQRVHLVTLSADGRPHLDDVTRQLTQLSGRYQDERLDAAVDMSAFASGGAVSVIGRSGSKSAGVEASAQSGVAKGQLDLRPYAEEAARSIEGGSVSIDESVSQVNSNLSGGR